MQSPIIFDNQDNLESLGPCGFPDDPAIALLVKAVNLPITAQGKCN